MEKEGNYGCVIEGSCSAEIGKREEVKIAAEEMRSKLQKGEALFVSIFKNIILQIHCVFTLYF